MAQKFDVKNITLTGANLIEASAGTGKTYSIAILMLRLLLEEQMPLKRILMVTFTNKAVAELQIRIRLFIRLAYQVITRGSCKDGLITSVVNKAIEKQGEPKVAELLSTALGELDQMQVFTIHGFCQNTIRQYAFETDQAFEQEVIADTADIVAEAFVQYRREVLNGIKSQEVFDYIHSQLNYGIMPEMAKKVMAGKRFVEGEKFLKSEKVVDANAYEQDIEKLLDEQEAWAGKINELIARDFQAIAATKIDKRSKLYKSIANGVDNFTQVYLSECNGESKYLSNYSDFRELAEATERYIEAKNDICAKYIYYYNQFIDYAGEKVEAYKRRTGQLTYDDLIGYIRKAAETNPTFREKMALKYEAVFIDEFQDTDANQYTIFHELYAKSGKTVFYIGDPKQSIYGWRQADLNVYKKAKMEVGEKVFSMNSNFRATAELIAATNVLLGDKIAPDLFMDEHISYQEVNAGNKGLGRMMDNGQSVIPVELLEVDDKEANIGFVCGEIRRLLSEEVYIETKEEKRKIRPSDIGVIVRSNAEAINIQQQLLGLGIPAIAKDTDKIFSSDEAAYIGYLLEAILNPTRGKINRVLFRKYFGFTLEAIESLDIDLHADIFRELKSVLKQSGIYNTMEAFLAAYGIRQLCMSDLKGQRILTNLMHITEVLHEAEERNRLSPEALLGWMQSAAKENNDAYEKRIESEENAVELITIHRCKGLSYNIVFAPSLAMKPHKAGGIVEFKEGNDYLFSIDINGLDATTKENIRLAEEQENRRLLYVTLTRPVYKCYVSWPNAKDTTITTLFPDAVRGILPANLITVRDAEEMPDSSTPLASSGEKQAVLSVRKADDRKLVSDGRMYSFSSLSQKHWMVPFEKSPEADDYTRFVLEQLPRGTQPGLFQQSIFEELDFSDKDSYGASIERTGRMYPNLYTDEMKEMLPRLVEEVMTTPLSHNGSAFTLNQIKPQQKRPEIEFYFNIKDCNKSKITALFPEVELAAEKVLQGHINGFIDLLFEHEGKYYILDWKSNYLGNRSSDYSPEAIRQAMTENNYHLQHLLYTVAALRFLRQMIPDFNYETHFGGVIYLFLRGVRKDTANGVFFEKTAWEKVKR
ncbi:MAG: UvrD-helicase domain-containing protein, partial [Bacteroidales bacterium]